MRIIGIDIAKKWFDSYDSGCDKANRFNNELEGWKRFLEGYSGNKNALHVVMEASGCYYLPLACWLHQQGITVSVLNPAVIRHYSRMKLCRIKTDAKDAQLIAGYGQEQKPAPWQPPSEPAQKLQQLISLREGLLGQKNKLNNQQEAFGYNPQAEPLVLELIEDQLAQINDSIARIDRKMQQLAQTHYRKCLKALQTIPGIGPKAALMLVCKTDGFARFEDGRKLASYVGLCPRVWQSGSSTHGRGSISKLGCAQLRKILYMCSWSAKKHNPACRQMYERLKARGKPEKVIKVAIAHKLLRQAFAVGSRREPFEKEKAMAA